VRYFIRDTTLHKNLQISEVVEDSKPHQTKTPALRSGVKAMMY
jgi:hypothetical protein